MIDCAADLWLGAAVLYCHALVSRRHLYKPISRSCIHEGLEEEDGDDADDSLDLGKGSPSWGKIVFEFISLSLTFSILYSDTCKARRRLSSGRYRQMW